MRTASQPFLKIFIFVVFLKLSNWFIGCLVAWLIDWLRTYLEEISREAGAKIDRDCVLSTCRARSMFITRFHCLKSHRLSVGYAILRYFPNLLQEAALFRKMVNFTAYHTTHARTFCWLWHTTHTHLHFLTFCMLNCVVNAYQTS